MSSDLKELIGRHVTVRATTIVALVGMQILLAIACALALRQNHTLRNEALMYQALAAPLVGRVVPAIGGIDWKGAPRQVPYGKEQRPTLVYGFSKNCEPCVSNWAAMRIVQAMSPGRLRIVYVNTSDELTEDYVRDHGMGV